MPDTPKDSEKLLSKIGRVQSLPTEPVHLTEDEATGDRFLIYTTATGIKVQLRYEHDELWLSQPQMAELFGVTRQGVNNHLNNIYDEGELDRDPTCKEILQVRIEGGREVSRKMLIHNLDAVIAVGYRVSSKQGTLFRRWSTDKLVQFATKGFVVDVERLKEPDARDHFRELREVIREIRAAEANVYRELREIISLCSDYAALDEHRKNVFFAMVQNKLLYAVTGATASEIRVQRANAARPNMGLTTWKGREPTKADIMTAKNFLGEAEVKDLNRFTNMLLDYFEQETELRRLVTTAHAESAVDKFVRNNDRQILRGAGTISKKDADDHCHAQYDAFNDIRKKRYLEAPDEDPEMKD